jgi:hypothetical protein
MSALGQKRTLFSTIVTSCPAGIRKGELLDLGFLCVNRGAKHRAKKQ